MSVLRQAFEALTQYYGFSAGCNNTRILAKHPHIHLRYGFTHQAIRLSVYDEPEDYEGGEHIGIGLLPGRVVLQYQPSNSIGPERYLSCKGYLGPLLRDLKLQHGEEEIIIGVKRPLGSTPAESLGGELADIIDSLTSPPPAIYDLSATHEMMMRLYPGNEFTFDPALQALTVSDKAKNTIRIEQEDNTIVCTGFAPHGEYSHCKGPLAQGMARFQNRSGSSFLIRLLPGAFLAISLDQQVAEVLELMNAARIQNPHRLPYASLRLH